MDSPSPAAHAASVSAPMILRKAKGSTAGPDGAGEATAALGVWACHRPLPQIETWSAPV